MLFNRILSMFGLGARRSPYGGYARRGGLASMLPLAFLAWRNRGAISSQLSRFRGNRAQRGALPHGI